MNRNLTVSVRLTREEWTSLCRIAAENDITLSEVVRAAIALMRSPIAEVKG